MSKDAEKPDHISREDWDAVDVPEATDQEFARAVPFKEAHPEAYTGWKRGLGRPTIDDRPKAYIGFRLAADVVEGVKASGKGYNSRVEKELRAALAKGQL